MNFNHKNQSGAVLMYAVIILSIGAITALTVLSRAGIDAFVDSNEQAISQEIRSDLIGCKDELLIQFTLDETYNPSQIDIGDAVCSATITSPTVDTREAVLTLSREGVARGIRVEFEVNPVTLTRVMDSYN